MMRSTLIAALVSAALPMMALAQTEDELKNDEKSPGDVLTYGMGYSQNRFSPLTHINRDNVKRLVPAWSYSMADNRGQEAQALVKDGIIYLTDHEKTVALDALSGKQIWKSVIEYPPDTTRVVCCGIVNRGAAMFDGKLFRTTLDAHVIALDLKTGKEVWRTKSADPKGRLFDDRGAVGRERRGHRRRGGRRIRSPRLPRGLRPRERQVAVAHLYHSGQGRTGFGDLAR